MQEYTRHYRCPECQASLKWSMTNGKAGNSALVICSNNMTASRIDFDPKTGRFCFWEGLVIRQRDGSVKYYQSDGVTFLRAFKTTPY